MYMTNAKDVKQAQHEAIQQGKQDIEMIKNVSANKEENIQNLKNLNEEINKHKQNLQIEFDKELKKLEDKFCIQFNYATYRNREIVLEIDNLKYNEGE